MSEAPGLGLDWDESALRHFAVDTNLAVPECRRDVTRPSLAEGKFRTEAIAENERKPARYRR